MIYIQDLKEEDIGKWVIYKSFYGDMEKGKIKSWNDKYIFVVYKCDGQWDRFQDYTGCATDARDLNFANLGEVMKYSNLKEAIKIHDDLNKEI